MSEPLPTGDTNIKAGTPAAEEPGVPQEIAYQPISGWAIAGLVVGIGFTLLVAISAIVGVFQGAPVFFPMWVLGFAVLGIALSLLGQWHVQNSEGTRAGAKLARIGIWLNLISGLTYGSYYFVTGFALERQADAFLMEKGDESTGFFPRLREGGENPAQLNAAFLLTLPPAARGGRPELESSMRKHHDAASKDGAPGALTQFRELNPLARLFFKQLGKDAEITALGVQNRLYEQRSHKIIRIYHIKTREVEMDVMIAVFSAEPEASGQGRKWFVNLRESGEIRGTTTLTPLGEGVKLLRQHSKDWLEKQIVALNEGGSLAIRDKTDWTDLVIPEGKRDDYRKAVHQTFAGAERKRIEGFRIFTQADNPGQWEAVDGKIRIYLLFGFGTPPSPVQPPFHVEGIAALETTRVIDPARFDAGAPAPEWNLVNVVFNAVSTPEPKGLPPKK